MKKRVAKKKSKAVQKTAEPELTLSNFGLQGDAVTYLIEVAGICSCGRRFFKSFTARKDFYHEKHMRRQSLHSQLNLARQHEDGLIRATLDAQKLYNYKIKVVSILPDVPA